MFCDVSRSGLNYMYAMANQNVCKESYLGPESHVYFSRYMEPDTIKLLDLCTFLDPRFKSTPYLDVQQRSALKDRVFRAMAEYSGEDEESSDHHQSQPQDKPDSADSCCLSQLLGGQYQHRGAEAGATGSASSNSKEESVSYELNSYINETPCILSASHLEW